MEKGLKSNCKIHLSIWKVNILIDAHHQKAIQSNAMTIMQLEYDDSVHPCKC